MRVLIVDDEPLARMRLRQLLDSLAPTLVTTVREAAQLPEALVALQEQPADLVLLDIGLPGRDGLQVALVLKALPQPPAVVFVTAHAEHALQAFALDAVDYLTKPVRQERLQEALQRVQQRLDLMRGQAVVAALEPVLVVSDRGRVLRLPVREVLYLRAEQKYVTLRTADKTLILDDTLSELQLRLGSGFLRVHRNALVAVTAIRALEMRGVGEGAESDGWAVRVAPLDEWLAVSRRQVAEVKAALQTAAAP
jgi:two-component system response regulator AlgR